LFGLFLGIEVVEVAEELVEAVRRGQGEVAIAQVVLAELVIPERIGYWPVMKAARPAVELGWA